MIAKIKGLLCSRKAWATAAAVAVALSHGNVVAAVAALIGYTAATAYEDTRTKTPDFKP